MIVDYVINPRDGSQYTFGKRRAHLTVQDSRRSGTITIPGISGGRDVYGTLPFPKDVVLLTYEWLVTPQRESTTFDALRDALNWAVDHGRPQKIYLRLDDGSYRTVIGKLRGKNLDVTKQSRYAATWSVTWELTKTEMAAAANLPGQWGGLNPDGTIVKWGQAGRKWGAVGEQFSLTLASFTHTLHNPDATADTTDLSLTLTGPYGPAGTPALGVNYIAISNLNKAAFVNGVPPTIYLAVSLPTTNDKATVDFGKRFIAVNGVSSWALLGRPPGQLGWLRLTRGDNPLLITIVGTPLGTLNGKATLFWTPQFGF
jgi:hypothetical protein